MSLSVCSILVFCNFNNFALLWANDACFEHWAFWHASVLVLYNCRGGLLSLFTADRVELNATKLKFIRIYYWNIWPPLCGKQCKLLWSKHFLVSCSGGLCTPWHHFYLFPIGSHAQLNNDRFGCASIGIEACLGLGWCSCSAQLTRFVAFECAHCTSLLKHILSNIHSWCVCVFTSLFGKWHYPPAKTLFDVLKLNLRDGQ